MSQLVTDQLIQEALAIELENAREADALGYMARALTIATMPHKAVSGHVFERENGLFTLSMMAPRKVGLPYGSYPRLLLSWLTTEAVRTKDAHIELGPTLSGFMSELGLIPAGGRWGTIHRLRDQMKRLFSCAVSCEYSDAKTDSGEGFRITRKYQTWWDPKKPDQAALWRSYVELSGDFFREVIEKPVPIDLRALRALKRSPLALDIYCWLTYRLSYLTQEKVIPWDVLQLQFGSEYTRLRAFKEAFIKHLKSVSVLYPEAKVQPLDTGLELRPSKPHVPKKIV